MRLKRKLAGWIETTRLKRFSWVVEHPAIFHRRSFADLDPSYDPVFSMSSNCEVTAECNPNDLTRACADAFAELGVNRISLGVQSLIARKLKILERDHDASTVTRAVQNARRIALSLSLDMIFASPGETLDDWQQDLESAIHLDPDQISTYELTYEKGTSFWIRRERKELSVADEEVRCQMYEYSLDNLAAHGFEQYEISSFARPGHQCRHNNTYWSGQPYFAFGPSASKYVDGTRETNHQSTSRYLKFVESGESPIAERESLSAHESALELLVLGLRRNTGIDRTAFANHTGYEYTDLIGDDLFQKLCREKLVRVTTDNIRLTRRGLMMCDWIASEILGSGSLN